MYIQEPTIIVISLLGIILTTYTFIMLFQLRKKFLNIQFLYLGIGFFLYGLIPISYIFLGISNSPQVITFATSLHKFMGIIAFAFGYSLTLIAFRLLIEEPIPIRYYFYIFVNIVVLPYIFATGFSFAWDGGKYVSIYNPNYFRYIIILPTFYVGIEISLSTFRLIKDTPLNSIKWLFLVMSISFLSTVPLFVLRSLLPLPFNIFLLPMIFYFVFLTLIINKNPEIFLTSSIAPQFLLIVEKGTGIPLKTFHFVDNDYIDSDDTLMAGALIAIQSVLKEMSKENQELSYLGFPHTHIIFTQNKRFSLILGSERRSYALKSMLRILDTKFETIQLSSDIGYLTDEENEALTHLIKSVFIHQLKRLDLMIK